MIVQLFYPEVVAKYVLPGQDVHIVLDDTNEEKFVFLVNKLQKVVLFYAGIKKEEVERPLHCTRFY